MQVYMTINGKPLMVDTDKLHESWAVKCLEYGVRRFVNDKYSDAKGDVKFDACQSQIKEMESGREYVPTKGSGRSNLDPVTGLAVRNAKADLQAIFKAITSETRAADMAKHPKVAPFFTVSDDAAVWKTAAVLEWIKRQEDAGKRDYLDEAQVTLSPAELDLDLGLDSGESHENDTDQAEDPAE